MFTKISRYFQMILCEHNYVRFMTYRGIYLRCKKCNRKVKAKFKNGNN